MTRTRSTERGTRCRHPTSPTSRTPPISWLLILTVVGAVIGIPLIIALFLVSAWCHIKGAIRAADDRPYDYPFQIRVLS